MKLTQIDLIGRIPGNGSRKTLIAFSFFCFWATSLGPSNTVWAQLADQNLKCWDGLTELPCTWEQLSLLDGAGCTAEASGTDLNCYRPVVILGTGFASDQHEMFFSDAQDLVEVLNDTWECLPDRFCPPDLFTTTHADKLLYLAYFRESALPTSYDEPAGGYGARLLGHPSRYGHLLALDPDQVHAEIDQLNDTYSLNLQPWSVVVFFNTDVAATANAVPPTFSQREWGIVKVTREQAANDTLIAHELGHSGLNFGDEYYEYSLVDTPITVLDVLTPLAQLGGSWDSTVGAIGNVLGVYDIRISHAIAHNGADNIATSRYPATVTPAGFEPDVFLEEGGAFFGRGVYHQEGVSFMEESSAPISASQQRVIDTAFQTFVPGRANDRLQAVGPSDNYPFGLGETTTVLIADADKLHRYHPTLAYQVQIKWEKTFFKPCLPEIICSETIPFAYEKTFAPTPRVLDIEVSALSGLANVLQKVVCAFVPSASVGSFDLCGASVAQLAEDALPINTLQFPMPYQEFTLPTPNNMTKYEWRVRTFNGAETSDWTSFSSFYRSF